MDLKLLADTLTTFLAPAMPYLVSGGEDLVRQAGKKLGEDGLELAKALWLKLRPKAEASPAAKEAAADVAAAPDDADLRAALRGQLRKILEADPELASELARMVETSGARPTYQATLHGSGAIAQGRGAVAVGKGGIAVGGNVQGDLSMGRRRSGDDGPDSDG